VMPLSGPGERSIVREAASLPFATPATTAELHAVQRTEYRVAEVVRACAPQAYGVCNLRERIAPLRRLSGSLSALILREPTTRLSGVMLLFAGARRLTTKADHEAGQGVAIPAKIAASPGSHRAELFNNCTSAGVYRAFNLAAHGTDARASRRHRFLYVDNVKAGSSSVNAALNLMMDGNDSFPTNTYTRYMGDSRDKSRFTTKDLTSWEASRLFKFSIVRDPVAKFESGVRQAWFRGIKGSADGMLRRQLSKTFAEHAHQLAQPIGKSKKDPNNFWVDEHLQPSGWRLSGSLNDTTTMSFDFIGSLEIFSSDWQYVVNRGMHQLSIEERNVLLVPGHENAKAEFMNKYNESSKLSEEGIRMMCSSEIYRHEWECFGYPLPSACIAHQGRDFGAHLL